MSGIQVHLLPKVHISVGTVKRMVLLPIKKSGSSWDSCGKSFYLQGGSGSVSPSVKMEGLVFRGHRWFALPM